MKFRGYVIALLFASVIGGTPPVSGSYVELNGTRQAIAASNAALEAIPLRMVVSKKVTGRAPSVMGVELGHANKVRAV